MLSIAEDMPSVPKQNGDVAHEHFELPFKTLNGEHLIDLETSNFGLNLTF